LTLPQHEERSIRPIADHCRLAPHRLWQWQHGLRDLVGGRRDERLLRHAPRSNNDEKHNQQVTHTFAGLKNSPQCLCTSPFFSFSLAPEFFADTSPEPFASATSDSRRPGARVSAASKAACASAGRFNCSNISPSSSCVGLVICGG